MVKKIAIGFGIFLVVIVIALAAIPFLFKDKIKQMVVTTLNDNVNATFAFKDVDISLFKSFPLANVSVDNLSIVNKAPFAGDTLFYSKQINLRMSVKELFKDATETMKLESIDASNSLVNIIFNKEGLGNFDIAIKKDEEKPEDSKPFALDIQGYAVNNLKFVFLDQGSNMKMVLDSINHTGKGNFAAQKLDLDTQTTTKVSFDMDSINFMNKVPLSLEAVLAIDLDKSKYEFKNNKALINKLPLEFNGFIQLVETGQLYDLVFKTPTSDFKNFLALIPEAYTGSIKDVKTTGQFTVNGKVKGQLTDTTIPTFNIQMASDNASFKYPDLPKGIKNITIDTHIVNETGIMNDTYVNLDNLSFAIDLDVFNAKANVRNLTVNPLVNAELKGVINLGNISKAYPVKLKMPLSGILKADVVTKFDMKSVETSQYQNIQNSGEASLTGFKYSGPELAKPLTINRAALAFTPNNIQLKEFDAVTGTSDLKVTGALDNFYGFMFKNQILKGNFSMNSNNLVVSDFMEPSTTTTTTGSTTTTTTEAVKIPAFLDCTINAKATKVVYDNLNLSNVSGVMTIKDEAIALSKVNMGVFGGTIDLSGVVSTKGKGQPTFNMDLGINAVNIAETFTQVEMLKNIAPIAGVIAGKLNSSIKLSGDLTKDMTPNLKTLAGDLVGKLISPTINSSNSTLLTALSSNVKFLDVSRINLDNLKADLSFKDGKVALKPMDLKYQDIAMTIGGTHGFDQSMNYNIKFDVPAKYLGNEINALISKLTPADAAKIESVPVIANLTGNFSKPTITTDIKQATTALVTQLVKYQKDKLMGQGAAALGDLFDKNKKPGDSTKTVIPVTKEDINKKLEEEKQKAIEKAKQDAINKAKEGLNGLFGGKKKE